MLKYEGMLCSVLYIPVHVLGLSWKCQKQRIRATNRKARGRSDHETSLLRLPVDWAVFHVHGIENRCPM